MMMTLKSQVKTRVPLDRAVNLQPIVDRVKTCYVRLRWGRALTGLNPDKAH